MSQTFTITRTKVLFSASAHSEVTSASLIITIITIIIIIMIIIIIIIIIKRQESITESYCDRDPKDQHAGICTNPQEGAKYMIRMNVLCV